MSCSTGVSLAREEACRLSWKRHARTSNGKPLRGDGSSDHRNRGKPRCGNGYVHEPHELLKVVLQEPLAADSAPDRVAADGHLQGQGGPRETAGEKIAGGDRMRAKEEQLA